MRIGSKWSLGLSVLAVGVALSLAGCTPPTAKPADAASASTTPSPTPTAAALPLPTLPVTCADVLSNQAASDILGTPVELKVDETTIRNIGSIATRQAGLLSCVWGGDSRTDNSWDDAINLDVLPNAAADYDAGVWRVDDGATPYTVGDLSEYLCPYADAIQWYCSANLLVGGYWAQVTANSGGGRTLESVEQSMATLLDSLFATITAAGTPAPAWSTPGGSIAGAFCTDPSASTVVVQDAFATADLNPPASVSADGPLAAAAAAQVRAGVQQCFWQNSQPGYVEEDRTGSVNLQVVPGGAWAFPAMVATPPDVSYMLSPLMPVTVQGGYPAIAACDEANECYAMVSVGGSLVGISADGQPLDAFANSIGKLAAAILAAG